MAGVADLMALPSQIAAAVGSVIGSFSMGSIAPRTAMLTAPLEQFTNQFVKAIKGILGPFEKITDLASHFVQDFDPALVHDLGMKFRDFHAVIGLVLRPIVDVSRGIVRSLSDYLLPAMKKLEPLVREISESVGGALKDGFKELGATLADLMPLFEALRDIVIGAIPMLDDLRQVIAMVRETFKALMRELFAAIGAGGVEGGLKGVMANLRKGFQDLIVAVYKFMASLFAVIGWGKGLEALMKSLNRREDVEKGNAQGLSIALNPMFKSIGELSKSVSAAMFAASDVGAADAKNEAQKQTEFLAEIKKAIELGKDDTKQIRDVMADVKEFVADAKVWIEKLPKRVIGEVETWWDGPAMTKLEMQAARLAKSAEAAVHNEVRDAIADGVRSGIPGWMGGK